MVILKILLLPFAVLYDLITALRNKLYDLGLKPSIQFEVPVICVGNLTVGGTGKTPMIEHLVRLLTNNYSVATLSRGYGRKTKGFRIADNRDSATTLGDEPFQFYRKFSPQITVAVGEERAFAIPNIIDKFPNTQVVLLDDGFQHRKVKPLFNILLTDFNSLFYRDYLLPAGRLRESKAGAARADVIVVTKCPEELQDDDMMSIEQSIREYADKPVFFTKIHYGFPVAFGGHKQVFKDKVILVSGIANPANYEDYVSRNFQVMGHIIFKDHHHYTESDMENIAKAVAKMPDVSVLTTEKDMVKMDSTVFQSFISRIPMFYLPIEIEFVKAGQDFDEMVQSVLKN